jgi:uncharacterized protein with PQ loop repeat
VQITSVRGYLAGALTVVLLVPQTLRAWRTKTTKEGAILGDKLRCK